MELTIISQHNCLIQHQYPDFWFNTWNLYCSFNCNWPFVKPSGGFVIHLLLDFPCSISMLALCVLFWPQWSSVRVICSILYVPLNLTRLWTSTISFTQDKMPVVPPVSLIILFLWFRQMLMKILRWLWHHPECMHLFSNIISSLKRDWCFRMSVCGLQC